MGRALLQGTPWHYEYSKGKRNVFNCIYRNKTTNQCQDKVCPNYEKECVGKKKCKWYISAYIPRPR